MNFTLMDASQIWSLLDANSGQLQTIFSFLGLALGIFAIWYARKQLLLSQAQRAFELRLQIIQISNGLLSNIRQQRVKFKAFKEQIEKGLDPEIRIFNAVLMEDFDKSFEFYTSLLDSPEKMAEQLIEGSLNTNLDIKIKSLENYLTTLHSIQGKLVHANEGLNRHVINLFGKDFLDSI